MREHPQADDDESKERRRELPEHDQEPDAIRDEGSVFPSVWDIGSKDDAFGENVPISPEKPQQVLKIPTF